MLGKLIWVRPNKTMITLVRSFLAGTHYNGSWVIVKHNDRLLH